MKKFMISLAMIITLMTSAFASDEKVRNEILKSFDNKFSGAQEVTWVRGKDYYKASFNYNDSWLVAYYNKTSELMGVTRNISSIQLPLYLQNSLKNKYSNYWITQLFEYSNKEGFRYYVTLENADKTITLESLNGTDWELYQSHNKY